MSIVFTRRHGRLPIPRWLYRFDNGFDTPIQRTFFTRWGCRRYAASLGAEAVWTR